MHDFDFKTFGKYLQDHECFEDGVNFGLISKKAADEINLRVFERGAGETRACGSGACAAAVIGVIKKELETPVKVNFELGSLLIDYKEESKMISATGKAEFLEKKEITI
jgi:diaminopimelate epimerase